jgi:homopolymeric O-antigen transport system permease protein
VKKLVFPVETLPVNLAVAGLVGESVMLALFVVGLAAARGSVPATVAWLPLILAPQILFTLGVCWFLAGLGVFVRDLGQVIGFLLTLWFFLTPICYPETQLPAGAMAILSKNPIFTLVRLYRGIFLEGQSPAALTLVKFWALSLVVFFAGHAWFYKLKRSFADIV